MAFAVRRLAALLLACTLLASFCFEATAAKASSGLFAAKKRSRKKSEPHFCVVVRTYWGHSSSSDGEGLRRLLKSLQRQNISNWEAILIVMDSRPFPDLHHIMSSLNDSRIWVFAEWIGPQYQPKLQDGSGEWVQGYHGHLYNLTDDAIQVCHPDTDWLLVTNGDNEYGQGFFQHVVDVGRAGRQVDIVAFDFYSRFQRITAPACVRFHAWDGAPACKRNRLRWCHTDLGANVLNYQRFKRERRRFGSLDRVAEGVTADHFDGIMAQHLNAGGWRVKYRHDVCLFEHSPSFHACAWRGGVWDDRDVISWRVAGGRCISQEEAGQILATDANAEEVTITPSSDNRTTAFQGVGPGPHEIRCLRRKDYTSGDVWGAAMDWFSMLCADDVDIPSFQAWEAMKANPAQYQQQQQQEAAQAAQQQAAAAASQAAAAAQQAVAAQAEQAAGVYLGQHDGGAAVDYWELQKEFYRTGVANAPDPPPKVGAPELHVEYRERWQATPEQQAQQQQQATQGEWAVQAAQASSAGYEQMHASWSGHAQDSAARQQQHEDWVQAHPAVQGTAMEGQQQHPEALHIQEVAAATSQPVVQQQ